MTIYANTLNEAFIKASEKLKAKGFRYHKKLLKVIDPALANFPLVNIEEVDVVSEARNNLWFFVRELVLSSDSSEVTFDWKTFIALDLLSSKKSSIIINDDLSLAMYLKWIRNTDHNPLIVIPDQDSRAILSEKLDTLKEDDISDAFIKEKSIPRFTSFDLKSSFEGEKHIILYAQELTNEILAFYLLNKDKAQITVFVESDELLYSNNIIPELQDKYEAEFHVFDLSYMHRHLMSNFSVIADLTKP